MRALLASIALVVAGAAAGCAGPGTETPVCATTFVIDVTPAAAAADHMATAPGNQVQFTETGSPFTSAPTGCALNNVISSVMWKSSDTVNVQLTPAAGVGSTVTATCVGSTTGAATITATQYAGGLTGTGTATLTCK